ncbi:MAG TPA: FAD-dependent oxidoreductase [Thermoanaerobaculia bacterium]|nr:FAD-dependent oxidoreductase [Thermoanaerobaculia bacterium]
MSSEVNESIWISTAPGSGFPSLDRDLTVDVVIVGGGITGITAATILKKAGKRVAVLELGSIAAAETGHTTAHLTEAIDAGYKTLSSDFGSEGAALIAEGSRDAISFIEELSIRERIDCGFERLPAFIYSETERDVAMLREEADASARAGVAAAFVSSAPLPFPTKGAIRFENQAQFHPRQYLVPLAQRIVGDGSHVFERSGAVDFKDGSPCEVKTERGKVTADAIFVAAHVPVNDLVAIFTKIAAYRSYAIAVEVSSPLTPCLFWDTEDPYHYIRSYSTAQRNTLIIGGEDHKTGMEKDTEEPFRKLEEYARSRFEVTKIVNRWSGQIIEPHDGLPFTGRNPMSKNIYVATGYAGQGMTFGTLSGMVVADLILGRENKYAKLLDATRVKPVAAAKDYIAENVDFPKRFILDRIFRANVEGHSVEEITAGEGKIISVKGRKVAIYRDESGQLDALSPVCPHMKCDVAWNSHEKSWDCPCHGSRFTCGGRVINGPAVTNLERIDPAELE